MERGGGGEAVTDIYQPGFSKEGNGNDERRIIMMLVTIIITSTGKITIIIIIMILLPLSLLLHPTGPLLL